MERQSLRQAPLEVKIPMDIHVGMHPGGACLYTISSNDNPKYLTIFPRRRVFSWILVNSVFET